ncbi:probable metal-nicotianamine transporter YSL12 [Phoenix dactylifera]|uniref:Probable metal-nicotianamine transporter YSL12 n=1 Tax=Phoenix dactylifera TaxID=42345 RepID=A0A8B8ZGV3_PHODC|nr:probable metal-nicotianamine transporter YSL12 [Phoenix dactylifera]
MKRIILPQVAFQQSSRPSNLHQASHAPLQAPILWPSRTSPIFDLSLCHQRDSRGGKPGETQEAEELEMEAAAEESSHQLLLRKAEEEEALSIERQFDGKRVPARREQLTVRAFAASGLLGVM